MRLLIVIRGLIFSAIKNTEEFLTGVIVGLITLFIFFQVITRYVLRWAVPELEEAAAYGMLVLVFISIGLVTRRRMHVKVDIVPLFIKNERAQGMFKLGADLIIAIASLVFIYLAFQYMMSVWEYPFISLYLKLNEGYLKVFLFIGAVLMGGYWVAIGVRDIAGLVKGRR